jgi:DNA-binding response OmpR family regulator
LIVFLIDDSADRLQTMELALAEEPYRLVSACTVEEALRKLADCRADAILLNATATAEDGTWLSAALLADETIAGIPVLALTDRDTAERGLVQQRNLYDGSITQPIDADSFPGLVRQFLDRSAQGAVQPTMELSVPVNCTFNRRKEAGKLLAAIEQGLPDSQFAAAAGTGLRWASELLEGLRHYDLADFLQRAEGRNGSPRRPR